MNIQPIPPYGPDLTLVRRVLDGDDVALAAFARRMTCVPRMVAALNKRMSGTLSAEEVNDVSQDVLVLIWSKLETYGGRAALESWAHRFAFLELKNHMRRKERSRRMESADLDDLPGELAEQVSPEAYEFLVDSLEELGPPACDVIRLRHYDDLTFDEIGERLRMPGNTAKTHYHRSLVKLRQRLASRVKEELS